LPQPTRQQSSRASSASLLTSHMRACTYSSMVEPRHTSRLISPLLSIFSSIHGTPREPAAATDLSTALNTPRRPSCQASFHCLTSASPQAQAIVSTSSAPRRQCSMANLYMKESADLNKLSSSSLLYPSPSIKQNTFSFVYREDEIRLPSLAPYAVAGASHGVDLLSEPLYDQAHVEETKRSLD
jgi:hypothetical protein